LADVTRSDERSARNGPVDTTAASAHAPLLGRLRQRWPGPAELVLFCLVGGSGVVVDFAVLYPLVALAHLDARLAAVPAFVVAVSWNYLLNRRFTFSGAREVGAGRSYFSFVAVCTAGVGIRIGAMHLLMVYAGWDHKPLIWLASLLGIVAATLSNFLGSKYLAFRRIAR
jgi:dolichol-phosphate mannosyltransferase